MTEAGVAEAGAERIDELEPLWRALYEHHASVAEGVGGLNSFEESWRRRRAQYEQWLAGDDHALLVADREGRLVGYAMLSVSPPPATWDFGRAVVEIETLSVLAGERGRGVGEALMRGAEEWARGRGADTLTVGLLHTNEGALRFYEREGFGSFYLELARDLR
jgi:GNAT superfamily N-acetyltransferase